MRNIIFRSLATLVALNIYYLISAQAKMVLVLNNKENTIYGYTLGDPSSANAKEIEIFGAMENANALLTSSQESGTAIPEIDILISDPASNSTQTLKLAGVKVKQIKNYTSNYTNGMFELTANGALNVEAICDFQSSELIYKNGNNTGSKLTETPALDKNMERLQTSSSSRWELVPNPTLKGTTGRIVVTMAVPSGTVITITKTSDRTQAETWHENSFNNEKRTATGNFLPGLYNVSFWNETLDSVKVAAGNDTRIKTGVLDLNSKSTWRILDVNKKEIYHMSLHQKLLLPIGTYYIVEGNGNMQLPITIKDGEITEFGN